MWGTLNPIRDDAGKKKDIKSWEKLKRPNKRAHGAAASGYKAEQPGAVFHTSAGAADNAWSVSMQANTSHLSALTLENSHQPYEMFDNSGRKQTPRPRVAAAAENEVAKALQISHGTIT